MLYPLSYEGQVVRARPWTRTRHAEAAALQAAGRPAAHDALTLTYGRTRDGARTRNPPLKRRTRTAAAANAVHRFQRGFLAPRSGGKESTIDTVPLDQPVTSLLFVVPRAGFEPATP